jgi:hypothetical protein
MYLGAIVFSCRFPYSLFPFPAFAAYLILLNLRVGLARDAEQCFMGDVPGGGGSETENKEPKSKPAAPADNRLLVAVRSHSNFVENVPFALLLAAFVEMNGLVGRLALFPAGPRRVRHEGQRGCLGWGGPVGFFGTLGVVGGLSSYAAWLVKSYWGF